MFEIHTFVTADAPYLSPRFPQVYFSFPTVFFLNFELGESELLHFSSSPMYPQALKYDIYPSLV